jgi:hypothetical protein
MSRPDVSCVFHIMDLCNTLESGINKKACQEGARDAHLLRIKSDFSSQREMYSYNVGLQNAFGQCTHLDRWSSVSSPTHANETCDCE